MNGTPFLAKDNVFNREQLLELKEAVLKHGIQEEDRSKCLGKRSDAYWCGRWEELPYVERIRHNGIRQVEEVWGYELWPRYVTAFMYNIYKDGGEYPWHIDSASEDAPFSDMKATMIINTSTEPYEGGGLHLATHTVRDTHVKHMDTPGNAIIFRSHCLHRVEPVTSGERTSLTMFFVGPKWR